MIFNNSGAQSGQSWLLEKNLNTPNYQGLDFSRETRPIELKLSGDVSNLFIFNSTTIGNHRPVKVIIEKNGNTSTIDIGSLDIKNTEKVLIDLGDRRLGSASYNPFNGIDTVFLIGDTSLMSSWSYFFQGVRVFEGSEIDFSGTTSFYNSFRNGKLEEIRFKRNTLSVSLNASTERLLSKNSIISLANCAKDGVVGKTLTLHANHKSICNSTIGTVSQVTENGVTFNFFTEDEDGDTTLTEFITDVKGWTLA